MSARYKIMCGCECCIYSKNIHSSFLSWRDSYLKNSKIKSKIIKSEGLVKKNITYMKHIKIRWCHMGVMFMPKHWIWKRLQFSHIISLIMHLHTGNVHCGAVPNVCVSIFLTKKQIKNADKQHPQLGFTFITSLDIVLLMVEFHWKKKNNITCVNRNFHRINLKYMHHKRASDNKDNNF